MKSDTLPSAKTVDEYLKRLNPEVRATLTKVRKTIQSAAPQAVEMISYKIPIFHYRYMLVGFAAFKNHCSLFALSKAIQNKFKAELTGYKTSAGTIQFTLDNLIPTALIKRMVKERIKENEVRYVIKIMKEKAKPVKSKNSM